MKEAATSTPAISALLILLAAVFGALGSYLYKSGSAVADGSLTGYLLNLRILTGVGCYSLVMILFVSAFRIGGSLTVLYPLYASTFIFAAFIALLAYGTPIKPIHVTGMIALVAGMYLMGK